MGSYRKAPKGAFLLTFNPQYVTLMGEVAIQN